MTIDRVLDSLPFNTYHWLLSCNPSRHLKGSSPHRIQDYVSHIWSRGKKGGGRSDLILWQKPLYPLKIQKAMWQHLNATKNLDYTTIQKAMWQHLNATKNLDYTTIADRFTTVNWSSDSYPAGMVKPVYGIQTFTLTARTLLTKGHTFKNL